MGAGDCIVLRARYKENRDGIISLFGKVDNRLTPEIVDQFFDEPKVLKAQKVGGTDYYALAVEVAQAICAAGAVICPYVNNLPADIK